MQQETAEVIALKALAWLAGNEELLPIFLGSTGLSGNELKERASEQETLIAVLDFLTMDDAWIEQLVIETGLDPHDPLRARQALPGGREINWT